MLFSPHHLKKKEKKAPRVTCKSLTEACEVEDAPSAQEEQLSQKNQE